MESNGKSNAVKIDTADLLGHQVKHYATERYTEWDKETNTPTKKGFPPPSETHLQQCGVIIESTCKPKYPKLVS
jgi:hypothetical protein